MVSPEVASHADAPSPNPRWRLQDREVQEDGGLASTTRRGGLGRRP